MAEKRPLCNYSGTIQELLGTDSLPGGSSGGIAYSVISENTNAITGNGYLINASSGDITLTLPGSPSAGNIVAVVDIYNKATTNTITVARNGSKIEGLAEDLVFDVNGAGFILVYADSTRGWEIVSEIGQGYTLSDVNTIGFDVTPDIGTFSEGKLYYDALWKTLSLEAGRDVTLQIGQEEWRRVYNNTGSTIYNGHAVYSNGVYSGGLPHVITVDLTDASDVNKSFVLGVTTQDIPNNSYGFITVRGNINGLKTDYEGWSSGDSLYLSTTPGILTNVKPEAPNLEVRVGRIIDVHATDGIINVRISQMYRLDNLSDVAVADATANQVLKYNGVSWIPADSSTTASAGGTNYFLTDSDTQIEGMTRANPCVVTWTGHGLTGVGHLIKFEGITQSGWTALNSVSPAANLWHVATIINENTFSIPVNTTGYAADYNPTTDPGTYNKGKLLTSPDASLSESIDEAQSTGNVEALIDSYSTSQPIGRTLIEGGEWTFDTWCYCSSTTDTNVIVIRVYKRSTSTGVETELFSTETADLGTAATLSRVASLQPAFTIAATDHLVVKYFAKSSRGSGLYRQFYLIHGGTSRYSLIKTPIAVAHNQLGGLNTSGYRHLPAAVADSDFVVGQASDGNWIKKTLAETKIILGVGESTGLFEIDIDGALMPNTDGTTDNYYDLDGNGDIQPKVA